MANGPDKIVPRERGTGNRDGRESQVARNDARGGGSHVVRAVARRSVLAGAALAGANLAIARGAAQVPQAAPPAASTAVLREAGSWRTWLIGSSAGLRLAPPPDRAAASTEVQELRRLAVRPATALARVVYWDAGGPSYRWNEIAVAEALRRGVTTILATRHLALLNAALHDAVIASWAAKVAHDRPRPATADPGLGTALPTPRSPAYPSAYAAAAGAAAEILADVFPDNAAAFRAMAEEAAESRVVAGVNYRSDVTAGLELGRAVGIRAVARGNEDGSDASWRGSVPTGPGRWRGADPAMPMAAQWRTWALARPDELRPPPPPAYDSPQIAAELAELRQVRRTPAMTSAAWFWEWGAGGSRAFVFFNELVRRHVLEQRMDAYPPQAVRAFALVSIAYHDALVACWDAKYAYWAIRPSQLDGNLQPLFPPPNHPSYPAAHGCLSTAAATALAHAFPAAAATFDALAAEAAEARIWAGIHFRSDIVAGRALGRKVAERVIAVAHGA